MTVSTEQFNVVNVGTVANDGTGDSLRAAFVKINENFTDFLEGTGFATGNITLTGAIEAQGNISTDLYFVGDGRFITNVTALADYTNSNVAAYLPTYSGNIADLTVTGNVTIDGTLVRKYWDQTNVYASSTAITLQPGGDDLVLMQISGNLDILYNNPIVAGCQADYTVWNNSAGNVYINLPNANTNLASGNIFVSPQTYTRLVFTAFGTTDANVVVSVS